MSDQTPAAEIFQETQGLWGTDHQPMGCPHCHRVFLVIPEKNGMRCPFCGVSSLESQPARMRPAEPEKVLPFKVSQHQLQSIYQDFTSGIWIKLPDFTPENLLARSVPVFWPLWMVDCDIDGHWQMEAGFDYQVESSKDYYASGRWQSRKQIETKIRWEPRLGEISYHVDNITIPALEEHENRLLMTGGYHLDRASGFNPEHLGSAVMEVPDLPPENAWPVAKPRVDQVVGEVSAQAADAQHSRNFAIKADYSHLNWTQFYLPLYATCYEDDDGNPQIVIVNGSTGAIHGPRLASPKRGRRIAGIVAAAAVALLLLTLIGVLLSSAFPPAGIIAALLGVLGFGTGIAAIIPAAWPAGWNRGHGSPKITLKR